MAVTNEAGFSQDSGTNAAPLSANGTNTKRYPVEFRGSGGEYFKIWIVNVLLTIITLYIYSAWAKVRTKRYFYGNTLIDNSSFEYHAKPLQILFGRIIAVVLLIVATVGAKFSPILAGIIYAFIFLALPWVIWRSLKFNARMSSFRNIRFGFKGKVWPLYIILFLLPLLLLAVFGGLVYGAQNFGSNETAAAVVGLGVVVFYLLGPWFHKLITSYSLNNHRYGTAEFSASISTWQFYWIYIKAFLLSIAIISLFGAILLGAAAATGLLNEQTFDSLQNDPSSLFSNSLLVAAAVGFYILIFLAGFVIVSYFKSRMRNYRFQQTYIGGRVSLNSTVRTWPLAWLTASNLILLVITLGLAYPWIKVRTARFFARNTEIAVKGSLDQFTGQEQEKISALGDELGEAFDLDLDIGI